MPKLPLLICPECGAQMSGRAICARCEEQHNIKSDENYQKLVQDIITMVRQFRKRSKIKEKMRGTQHKNPR